MNINFRPKMKVKVWLTPEDPNEPLESAVERAKALGNTILEVDEAGRRILIVNKE